MEFALQTVADSYDGFLAAAKWAESKGMAAFAIPDHYVYGVDEKAWSSPAYDAFSVMAGLARETKTIELVILVSPITFRHPSVLVKNTATIQEMSGGRFKLGVGTGWMVQEHELFGIDFPDTKQRFAMTEEVLGYMRAAFASPPTDFSGDFYSFRAFDMQPRPELKLVVGGTGAVKTPHLAGTFADELNAYPAAPEEFLAKIELGRNAAISADRDPKVLLISSSGQVVAADTHDEYLDLLSAVAKEHDTDVDKIEEEAEKRNAPRGTWDQVRSILSGMEEAGMSRFYFQKRFDADDIELALSKLS